LARRLRLRHLLIRNWLHARCHGRLLDGIQNGPLS
jgi:hypothetical protein